MRSCWNSGSLRPSREFTLRISIVALLVAAFTQTGCINADVRPQSLAAVAAAPKVSANIASEDWGALLRSGRQAMRAERYSEAEMRFGKALTSVAGISRHDARTRTSLSSLVRLAARHEALGSADDADRVLSLVRGEIGRRGIDSFEAARYEDLYRDLAQLQRVANEDSAPRPKPSKEDRYDGLIARTARSYRVDPALVKAVVAAESNFESRAVSRVGAQGLMQLMPETAKAMGVRSPFTPSENLRGGVRYLRKMLDRYGQLKLALAAYNAGPAAVDRHGGVPPYPETTGYIERVLDFYQGFQGHFAN
jgi:hypothetical protein